MIVGSDIVSRKGCKMKLLKLLSITLSLTVLPTFAQAQQPVPVPSEEVDVNGYRILAIGAGAVGGVIVANLATAGMITPWITAGAATGGMPAVMGSNVVVVNAARAVVLTAGALGGGTIGNWLYGDD
jgi:hypothetical protein